MVRTARTAVVIAYLHAARPPHILLSADLLEDAGELVGGEAGELLGAEAENYCGDASDERRRPWARRPRSLVRRRGGRSRAP